MTQAFYHRLDDNKYTLSCQLLVLWGYLTCSLTLYCTRNTQLGFTLFTKLFYLAPGHWDTVWQTTTLQNILTVQPGQKLMKGCQHWTIVVDECPRNSREITAYNNSFLAFINTNTRTHTHTHTHTHIHTHTYIHTNTHIHTHTHTHINTTEEELGAALYLYQGGGISSKKRSR